MPARIAIIQGHPDPDPKRLCRALAASYAEGAQAAGHSVTTIDLATLDIPFLRTADDFAHGTMPAALRPGRDAIMDAEHLVFVFPLWLGTMPALVKAWLEQVMRPGTAFAYQDKGFPKKLLAGRSARVIVTMGMPAFIYRWFYLGHGLRGLYRNILGFVGVAPIRETLVGMAEGMTPEKVEALRQQMSDLGSKAS